MLVMLTLRLTEGLVGVPPWIGVRYPEGAGDDPPRQSCVIPRWRPQAVDWVCVVSSVATWADSGV